jgi:hypothetical protein
MTFERDPTQHRPRCLGKLERVQCELGSFESLGVAFAMWKADWEACSWWTQLSCVEVKMVEATMYYPHGIVGLCFSRSIPLGVRSVTCFDVWKQIETHVRKSPHQPINLFILMGSFGTKLNTYLQPRNPSQETQMASLELKHPNHHVNAFKLPTAIHAHAWRSK